MTTIRLELSLAETNRLLDALGSEPYREVYALIAKIQRQAEAQLRESGTPAPAVGPGNGGGSPQ